MESSVELSVANKLKVGDRISLRTSTGSVEGTITSIGELQNDPSKGAAKSVRFSADDPSKLTPGQSASITSKGNTSTTLAVPTTAVRQDSQGTYVLVEKGGSSTSTSKDAPATERVNVEVLRTAGGYAAINANLQRGTEGACLMSRRKITPDASPGRAPTVAPNVASAATPAAGLGTAPAIEMHGITRVFEGSERPVLNHLDLVVERGEFLAIIGPSGSGKSTLLNAIGLLDTPTSGTYSLFGKNTEGLSDRERDEMRRDHLGFIFQSSNMLLDETSTTNASMGLRVQGVPYGERLQRTEETLEFLGLSDRASIRTRYLSGGEKQRYSHCSRPRHAPAADSCRRAHR